MDRDSVLLVVHGMGETSEGSTVQRTVKPLVKLMKRRSDPDDVEVVGGTANTPRHTDIRYTGNGNASEIRVTEFWWAQSFNPAGILTFVFWIAWRVVRHLIRIASMYRRRLIDDQDREIENRFEFRPAEQTRLAALTSGAKLRWIQKLAVIVQYLLLLGVVIPFTILSPVIIPALAILSIIPGTKQATTPIKEFFNNLIIGSLADIWVIVEDRSQSRAIRDSLVTQIKDLAAEHGSRPIVLFAHSTGNLIVYDALAQLREEANMLPVNPRFSAVENGRANHAIQQLRTWVSIGSILTMDWKTGVVRGNNQTWRRNIPERMSWVNLWSRYDIATGSELYRPAGATELERGPVNRRVVNFGSMALDHTGFWENEEEVFLVLLDELGGRRPENDFWRQANDVSQISEQEELDIRSRRRYTPLLMITNAIAWLSIPAGAAIAGITPSFASKLTNNLGLTSLADFFNFGWISQIVNEGPTAGFGERLLFTAIIALIWFVLVYLVWYFVIKVAIFGTMMRIERNRSARRFLASKTTNI